MFLVVNNGDELCTSSLKEIIEERQQSCLIVPPDTPYADIAPLPLEGVLLSGGKKSRDLRNPVYLDSVSLNLACLTSARVPVFGICYGFEFLICASGGRLQQLQSPVPQQPVAIEIMTATGVFSGLPARVEMWEFNTLGAVQVPPFLTVTAKSGRASIESVAHFRKPVFGTQFHPEAVVNGQRSQYGKRVINNFIDYCLRWRCKQSQIGDPAR